MDVRQHFNETHGRKIEFTQHCHLCEKILPPYIIPRYRHLKTHPVPRDPLLSDFKNYNDALLRTKCGLRLTRNEITFVNFKGKLQRIPINGLRNNKKSESNITNKTEPSPCSCSVCGKAFKWKSSMLAHMDVLHAKKSRYTCSICKRPFSRKDIMDTHIITHMNKEDRSRHEAEKTARMAFQKPKATEKLVCDVCGILLNGRGSLSIHQKTHLPEESRKLYCSEPNCGYSCFNSISLKRHMDTTHSQSSYFKFKCDRCSQGFRSGLDFRTHILFCCEPLERPYPCQNCGKRFKLKQHLELHYRDMHQMGKEAAWALVYPGLNPRPRKAASIVPASTAPVVIPASKESKKSYNLRKRKAK